MSYTLEERYLLLPVINAAASWRSVCLTWKSPSTSTSVLPTSAASSANSITSICCWFVVHQVVKWIHNIHNIVTCRRTCDQHNNPRLLCWSQVVQQIHNKPKKWSLHFSQRAFERKTSLKHLTLTNCPQKKMYQTRPKRIHIDLSGCRHCVK